MSLFFSQPWLLPLLALAGLPLLVHLLSRTRPPVYRFSNLDFLQRVVKRTARFRKPKDWLLLALRTLAIAALLVAFLRPLLLSKNAPLPGEKHSVILLVDRSASMAARDGATTRFESAVLAAREALDSLRPDAANLVWIDAEPSAIFPEPAPNRSFLAESLEKSSARPESGALARAWELALRQCAVGAGRKELIIISDFQASAWEKFDTTVPAGITVRAISVAKGDSANVAVSSLVASPAEPVAGQEITVLARVRNFSGEVRRSNLLLDAAGSHQSRLVDLPAWGSAEAAFTVRCPAAGLLALTASLEDDAFPGDDHCHSVLHIRESLRMAVATQPDSPEARVAHSLANSLLWLDVVECPDANHPPPCDVLLVPAWKGDGPAKLRALSSRATTLIVFPAAGISARALADLTGNSADAADGIITLEARPEGWQATPVEGHPMFALFASGEFGNPLAGMTRQRLRLPSSIISKGEILGSFSDGTPALVSFPTPSAPIILSSLPLDLAQGDWTTRATFLPGFAEMILHSRPRISANPFAVEPGSFPAWSPADSSQATTLTLSDPTGKLLPLEQKTGVTGPIWRSSVPAVPGIYSWLVSGLAVHHSVVNFPESESDLRVLPQLPSFGIGQKPSDSLARSAALDQGLPLWPWLVGLALLVLLVEPLIAAPTVPKIS
jgi:Aerotolerance regulator N-terminal/von Willebrand factor type A domain